ncbi:hypothetical protein [Microbacterium sp. PMB16]|uniref:hypothetical protein n=1 Tax=Microbacterium sp. PMB16 TaxID=3120157 RepID=UPI003F4CA8CC
MGKKKNVRENAQGRDPRKSPPFDLAKLAWVGGTLASLLAAFQALAGWWQGVHIFAVIAFLLLMLFSIAFVVVNVVLTWERCSSEEFERRATLSLVVVGSAHGGIVVLLVVLDSPDVGSTSFVFAATWMVLTAFAITFARERAAQHTMIHRLRVVAFRSGVTTLGMTIVALTCGGAGLMIREMLRGNTAHALFFLLQTTFLAALAFLVLLGRRRGIGIGFLAIGLAVAGTAAEVLLRGQVFFGNALAGLAVAAVAVGVTAIRRGTAGFGGSLILAGAAVVVVGFAAREDGTLPFFVLYLSAGIIIALVGGMIVMFPTAVAWNDSSRTGPAVFFPSLAASLITSCGSALVAWHWVTLGQWGFAACFAGYVTAGLMLGGGAVWAWTRGDNLPRGKHVPDRRGSVRCSDSQPRCSNCPILVQTLRAPRPARPPRR